MMLIFVCVGCLTQQLKINCKYITIKWWFSTKLHQIRTWLSRPLNQRFLMTYSSLIFKMRRLSRTAIKDKPWYTTIKHWLETMSIPHKKISGDISLVFWLHTKLHQKPPLYVSRVDQNASNFQCLGMHKFLQNGNILWKAISFPGCGFLRKLEVITNPK